MPLKRMSEFKRDDYTYASPDGDEWTITIVQTEDRKYVEIKKGEEEQVNWDVEMLLDISDAVRQVTQKPLPTNRKHNLKSPNVVDYRNQENNDTPADHIHAAVAESMENVDSSSIPVESFSKMGISMSDDIERRKSPNIPVRDSVKVKRS